MVWNCVKDLRSPSSSVPGERQLVCYCIHCVGARLRTWITSGLEMHLLGSYSRNTRPETLGQGQSLFYLALWWVSSVLSFRTPAV